MQLTSDALRHEIAAWLDRGETLDAVDAELIEPAIVSEDERAALWLFAWSFAKRRQATSRPTELVAS
jgi:hypothetical protein